MLTYIFNPFYFSCSPLSPVFKVISEFLSSIVLHGLSLYLLLCLEPRLERKRVKRKRVFATLKALGTVLEQLSQEIPDEVGCAVLLKSVSNLE